jgi:hypothetical protein
MIALDPRQHIYGFHATERNMLFFGVFLETVRVLNETCCAIDVSSREAGQFVVQRVVTRHTTVREHHMNAYAIVCKCRHA